MRPPWQSIFFASALSVTCSASLSQDKVAEIENLANSITANKSSSAIKKALVKGIPRQAVLKPSDAVYRLQNQSFALGDRVTMVQDTGGVPLSAKGVVVGLGAKSMDVVWDVPFMSGVTLGDKLVCPTTPKYPLDKSCRCSQYRGSTVEFNSCLNLTNPQFVASTNPRKAPPTRSPLSKTRSGSYAPIKPPAGLRGLEGFRPTDARSVFIYLPVFGRVLYLAQCSPTS
jgi:hypothetical protein